MQPGEFEAFVAMMKSCGKVFGKSPDNDLIQAYWHSLSDVAYSTVKDAFGRHIKFARYFPKPFELRERGDDGPKSVETAKDRADFKAATAENQRNWEALAHERPQEAKWALLWAKMCRAQAQFENTPQAWMLTEHFDKARALADGWIARDGVGVITTNYDAFRVMLCLRPQFAVQHGPTRKLENSSGT